MKRLLLVGGGHAHVEVLRRFGIDREPGVDIVVVDPATHAAYSGMLPGLVAGHYQWSDVHIDLTLLAARADGTLVTGEVTGIDPGAGAARCADGSDLGFDVCSIDVGSVPATGVPGAREHAVGVKPVGRFLAFWSSLGERIGRGEIGDVAVVGGGAGGVEVILAMQHATRRLPRAPRFHLLTDGPRILPSHPDRVGRIFERVLSERGVDVLTDARVVSVGGRSLQAADGRSIDADAVFWTTGASAPVWIGESGLATDDRGFLQLDRQLRSVSHRAVFGAGDAVAVDDLNLPKAGVFAVRQGPVLARNLRAALRGEGLATFESAPTALNLISTGERRALMSWQRVALEGAWVWRWKDWIDRRFVERYR